MKEKPRSQSTPLLAVTCYGSPFHATVKNGKRSEVETRRRASCHFSADNRRLVSSCG